MTVRSTTSSDGFGTKKRSDILDTAALLFNRHGYGAVGIDRIIAESGVAKMTLYRHFALKNDLILEVLKNRSAAVHDEIERRIHRRTTGREKIKAIFDFYHDWVQDADFCGCLFSRAVNEFDGADDAITQAARLHKAELLIILAEIVRDLGISARHRKEASLAIAVLIEGAIAMAHASGNKRVVRESWKVAAVLLEKYESM